jgi:Ca-activated chloride channel family protein
MQFEHTNALYLLSLIPFMLVLYVFTAQWRRAAIKTMGDSELMYRLMQRFSPKRKFLKLVLLLVAFTAFVIALANLRMGSKKEKIQNTGSEVIICFDVSRSMLTEDMKPNRISRAHVLAEQLVESLAGNNIGLVVFAGKAFVQMPLTVDAGTAKVFLSSINTNMIQAQGTNISEAIQVAIQLFDNGSKNDDKAKNKRAIILITDGESHDDDALEMAHHAAEKGIKLITIGVGTPQGGPIPIQKGNAVEFKKDNEGNIVLSKLNASALEDIARAGNGIYMNLAGGNNVMRDVRKEIDTLDKETGATYEFTEYQNHFQLFLVLGIVFLTAEFFMSDKKPQWLDKINIFGKTKHT